MVLSIELKMLLGAVVLGLIQLLLSAQLSTAVRGLAWNVSARDKEVPELPGVPGRVDRAFKNFMQTFPFFAAVILMVQITTLANSTTSLGAQMYLYARIVYVPLYAFGVPYLRSLVWGISLVGIILVMSALF